MKTPDLDNLTDTELQKQAVALKKTRLYDALIIGFLIGIGFYSIGSGGSFWFLLLPLIYLPIAGSNHKKRGDILALLERRGLEA